MSNLQALQSVLSLYERASSQKLNREKTSIFFIKAASEGMRKEISNFLWVPEVKEYEKYLGLLVVVGRNKKASLRYIKERVWNKLQGWKEKLLSQAGRETLLKAVVQPIPTFIMSCFKLPVSLYNEIEALIQKFYWGRRGSKEKSIGKNGKFFVRQNQREGWGSKIWGNSMMQCWQNRYGGC